MNYVKKTIVSIFIMATLTVQCTQETKDLIHSLYTSISGFNIPNEESELFNKEDAASTYGEITYEGVDQLLRTLHVTDHDVFYDLGSGVGKMVIQVCLDTPIKKSVGIELSGTRHADAMNIAEQLKKKNYIKQNKMLRFECKNILNADISDATIVYLASTCFSDECMKKVTKKLATLKKGLRVITLRKLPDNEAFTLTATYNLPMTWSNQTPVYVYTK